LFKHHSALGLATALRPVQPVTLIRPHAAERAARFFVEKFPGKSLYAVKANPSPALIALLWDNGITHFDVASLSEVRLVRDNAPEAVLCFMHPVKAEEAIREAYFDHGVRTFSLDTSEELDKIVRATDGATDLTLCVRIRVSSDHSKLSLASKFGADPADVKQLLIDTRQVADALGICFHVGSQAMTPSAYTEAMERVRAAIVGSGVTVDNPSLPGSGWVAQCVGLAVVGHALPGYWFGLRCFFPGDIFAACLAPLGGVACWVRCELVQHVKHFGGGVRLVWPHVFGDFLYAKFRHSRMVGFVAAGFKDNSKMDFLQRVLVLAVHYSVAC
jgi:hypothetical protein